MAPKRTKKATVDAGVPEASVTPITAPNTVTDTSRANIDQPLLGAFATYTGKDQDDVGTGDLLIVERVVSYAADGRPEQVLCSQRHGGGTNLVQVAYGDLKAQRTRNG